MVTQAPSASGRDDGSTGCMQQAGIVQSISTLVLGLVLVAQLGRTHAPASGEAPRKLASVAPDSLPLSVLSAGFVLLLAVLAHILSLWSSILTVEHVGKVQDDDIASVDSSSPRTNGNTSPRSGTSVRAQHWQQQNLVRQPGRAAHHTSLGSQRPLSAEAGRNEDMGCFFVWFSARDVLRSQARSAEGMILGATLSRWLIILSWPCLFDPRPIAGCILACSNLCRRPSSGHTAHRSRTDSNKGLAGQDNRKRRDSSLDSPQAKYTHGDVRPVDADEDTGNTQANPAQSSGRQVQGESSPAPSPGRLPSGMSVREQASGILTAITFHHVLSAAESRESAARVHDDAVPLTGSLSERAPTSSSSVADSVRYGQDVSRSMAFAASTSIPTIVICAATALAVAQDLVGNPGRGSAKAIMVWIAWPLLTPYDADNVSTTWFYLHLFYLAFVAMHSSAVSLSGDSWPLGQDGLRDLPVADRYSFASPLGLNGLGLTLNICTYSLMSLFYGPVLGLEAEFLRWRGSTARKAFDRSLERSKQQQQVVVDAVVQQVPPFAQDCMEVGVLAFEARPVVMAVQCARKSATGGDTIGSVHSERPSFSDGRAQGKQTESLGQVSTTEPHDTKGLARGQVHAVALCSYMEGRAAGTGSEQLGMGLSSQWTPVAGQHFVPRGFFCLIRDAFRTASRSTTSSVGAAALGVLSRQGRRRLLDLQQVDWRSVSRSMHVEKLYVESSDKEGAWVGTAGLRTPARSGQSLPYGTQRVYVTFSCLAAIYQFVLGAAKAKKDHMVLRCGISCPSSSVTSMVVGLMGLQQQPHEWSAFGGGQSEALRLMKARSSNAEIESMASIAGSEQPNLKGLYTRSAAGASSAGPRQSTGAADRHVACLSLEAAERLLRVLTRLSQTVDAAVQWFLAIAADSRTQVQGGDTQRIRAGVSSGALQLAQVQELDKSIQILKCWMQHVIKQSKLAESPAVKPDASARGMSSDSRAGVNGRHQRGVQLELPCQLEHVSRASSDQLVSLTLQKVLQSVGALLRAATVPDIDTKVTADSAIVTSTRPSLGQNARLLTQVQVDTEPPSLQQDLGLGKFPSWLSTILKQQQERVGDGSILPVGRAQNGFAAPGMPQHSMRPLSQALLPGLVKAVESGVSFRATGLPTLSGFLMAGIGVSLLCSSTMIPIQTILLEITAGYAEWNNSMYVALAFVPFIPRILASVVMIGVGTYAHVHGTLLDPATSLCVYGIAMGCHAVAHALSVLELVQQSCFAWNPGMNTAPSAGIAALLVISLLRNFGYSTWVFAVSIFTSSLVSTGLYQVLKPLFEGASGRPFQKAAEECSRIWGDFGDGFDPEQVSPLTVFIRLSAGIFTLHFVLVQMVRSEYVQQQVNMVARTAQETAKVLKRTRTMLQAAAASVMPRAVVLHKLHVFRRTLRRASLGHRTSLLRDVSSGRSDTHESASAHTTSLKVETSSEPVLIARSSAFGKASLSTMRVSPSQVGVGNLERSIEYLPTDGMGNQISLGDSVVATVILGGYSDIAELAGSVACLGLHRQVGVVIDAICGQYGAIRMRGVSGTFRLGWFESQKYGQPVTAEGSRSFDIGWKVRAVTATIDMLYRIIDVLSSMDVALRPVVGLGSGPVNAIQVGVAPSQIMYVDAIESDQPKNGRHCSFGSTRSSWAIARMLQGRTNRTAVVPVFDSVGAAAVSPSLATDIVEHMPLLRLYLSRVFNESFRTGVTAALASSPEVSIDKASAAHVLAWRELLGKLFRAGRVSVSRQKLEPGTPGTPVLIPVSVLCTIRTASGYEGTAVLHSSRAPTTCAALLEWQTKEVEALRACIGTRDKPSLSGEGASEAGSSFQSWVATWLEAANGSSNEAPSVLIRSCPRVFRRINGSVCTAVVARSRLHVLIQPEPSKVVLFNREIGNELQQLSRGSRLQAFVPRSYMSDYQRLKVLGEGGFGRVYLAVHRPTGNMVALKVSRSVAKAERGRVSKGPKSGSILSFSAGNSANQASLRADVVRAEIRSLLHCGIHNVPGVCNLEGVVIGPGEVGLALELAKGRSLAQLLRMRGGRMRMKEGPARSIARQLACSIFHMHSAGVLHRDIKPSNIMLDPQGRAKLLDFGLASKYQRAESTSPSEDCRDQSGVIPIQSNWRFQGMHNDIDLRLVLPTLSPPLHTLHPAGARDSVQRSGLFFSLLLAGFTPDSARSAASGTYEREGLERIGHDIEEAGKMCGATIVVSVASSKGDIQAMIEDEPSLYDAVVWLHRADVGKSQVDFPAGVFLDELAKGSTQRLNVASRDTDDSKAMRPVEAKPKSAHETSAGTKIITDRTPVFAVLETETPGSSRYRLLIRSSFAQATDASVGELVACTQDLLRALRVSKQSTIQQKERAQATGEYSSPVPTHQSTAHTHPTPGHSSWSSLSKKAGLQRSADSHGGAPSAWLAQQRHGAASGAGSSGDSQQRGVRETSESSRGHKNEVVVEGPSSRWVSRGRAHGTAAAGGGPAGGPFGHAGRASVSRRTEQRSSSHVDVSGATHGFWNTQASHVRLEATESRTSFRENSAARSQSGPRPRIESVSMVDWAKQKTLSTPQQSFTTDARTSTVMSFATSARTVLRPEARNAKRDEQKGEKWSQHTKTDPVLPAVLAQHGVYYEKQAFVAGIAGTPLFMAPELFKHQGQRASDYWSLGVTLFWLLAGRMPFSGANAKAQMKAARKGTISWHLLPIGLSADCLDCLRGLLEPEVQQRYDENVLAGHPWLLPSEGEVRRAMTGLDAASGSAMQQAERERPNDTVRKRWEIDNPFDLERGDARDHSQDQRVSKEAGNYEGGQKGLSSSGMSAQSDARATSAEEPDDQATYSPAADEPTLLRPSSCLLPVGSQASLLGGVPGLLASSQTTPSRIASGTRSQRGLGKRVLREMGAGRQRTVCAGILAVYYNRLQVQFSMTGLMGQSAHLVSLQRRTHAATHDLLASGMPVQRVSVNLLRCDDRQAMLESIQYMEAVSSRQQNNQEGRGIGESVAAGGGGRASQAHRAVGDIPEQRGAGEAMPRSLGPRPRLLPRNPDASTFGVGIAAMPSVLEQSSDSAASDSSFRGEPLSDSVA